MDAAADGKADYNAVLTHMLSSDAIEQALDDMPEVAESEFTVGTTQRLQSLSSATISADLLSDRMFQLESSLSAFQHACDAFHAQTTTPTPGDHDAGFEVVGASAGGVVWEALEPQVFDLDIDKSRDHVQQYRLHLEEQSARRDELLAYLSAVSTAELFPEPLFRTGTDTFESQQRALEQLYTVCADAEATEKRQAAEKQVAYRESYGTNSYAHHRRSDTSVSSRYDSDRALPLRRHSSSDAHSSRYDESRYSSAGGSSKRPKLLHAQSVDAGDATRRWGEPSPSSAYRPVSYRDEPRYSPHGRDSGATYSPSARGSRWDMRPPPGADFGHRGRDVAPSPRDRRW